MSNITRFYKCKFHILHKENKVIACFVGISYFPEHYRFYGHKKWITRLCFITTHKNESFYLQLWGGLFLALQNSWYLGLWVFWRRDSLAGCWKWQRVVGCVREVFKRHRVASCVWCFGERRALSPLQCTRGEKGTCRERSGARIDIVNFCGACGRHVERI